MRLDNKVALVTGAASGFGQGIAEIFAREGARVAVLDINEQAARQAAASISNKAIPRPRPPPETPTCTGGGGARGPCAPTWTQPCGRPSMRSDESTSSSTMPA